MCACGAPHNLEFILVSRQTGGHSVAPNPLTLADSISNFRSSDGTLAADLGALSGSVADVKVYLIVYSYLINSGMDPIANLISEEDMDRFEDQFAGRVQRIQAWLTEKARKIGSDSEVLAKAINGTTTRDMLLPELLPMNNSILNEAKPGHLPSKPDIMRKYIVRTDTVDS